MPAQTIMITGARTGLGRGLAEAFLTRNWRVVGCSRGDSDLRHPDYRHFTVDVNEETGVTAMFNRIRGDYAGELSALINCAAIARMNPALLTPGAMVERIMRTNFTGTFVCCREAAKIMIRQKYGRIVNFTSIAVPLALSGESVYGASKAAVESLTRCLARELGGYGITVNCIGPNPIRTDMIANIPAGKLTELIDRQAVSRFGEIRDVINVIDFFLRPESDLITGQVLYLGGPP